MIVPWPRDERTAVYNSLIIVELWCWIILLVADNSCWEPRKVPNCSISLSLSNSQIELERALIFRALAWAFQAMENIQARALYNLHSSPVKLTGFDKIWARLVSGIGHINWLRAFPQGRAQAFEPGRVPVPALFRKSDWEH